MSIKQANMCHLSFFFFRLTHAAAAAVAAAASFMGRILSVGVRCRATAVVGRMWGQSRLPKHVAHSLTRKTERKKNKKNGMTFG